MTKYCKINCIFAHEKVYCGFTFDFSSAIMVILIKRGLLCPFFGAYNELQKLFI